MIAGFRCATCGTTVDIATPLAWRCPRWMSSDRHHVLHIVEDEIRGGDDGPDLDDPNPFLRFGPRLAWWAFARANGMTEEACEALTREVAGDFAATPFGASEELSAEAGRTVWVKDETGNVGGSHKARHLVTILLHLRAAETLGLLTERRPLAIASCGNAGIAAALLARGADWPLQAFVPDWASEAAVSLIESLGAQITTCPRRDDDPPGDPAVLRFRDAVDAGAVPFSVQGPDNAYCLDGGRTIGWEMASVVPDRVYVQVGGGALAACVGAGLGRASALYAVQTEGCAPLARAWDLLGDDPIDGAARRWSDLMFPWDRPRSAADGILDDETYDWLGVVEAMRASGGAPVVATEDQIGQAHALAAVAGIDASPTGTAGLAGVLASLDSIEADELVAVIFSGAARPPPADA
jgi:threonine synthase